ncbi:MAG TPA: hypothetical protein PK725_11820 [Rhodocyclaceae bacterium]|jgi:sortase A|nr:hypothetical protein [Rhodocyclaceae bacterium]HRQ47630.1 hypothetical protein [Rhodocyclaceae bacterium]
MRPTITCRTCRSKDFLGVECAWPATDCVVASHTRRRLRVKWSLRVMLLATTIALIASAWQFLS